ncbi:oxidoreductase [Nocardioides donggukensis]|uniref:SDR family NAD(P)-dependent oxidoreductase n=1 Tax=Nocardioides donggukensis TaxID=2774019 RepID=A0A927K148_9ACTN|nr:oxidoreductase [Nocardioides donggukensis]MBD8868182.1 SDR family NAD(P)-dependent oxidoreductase [Nocardioides donggukensis]
MSTAWHPDDIPDLTGRTCLVTGATSGIGRWTALELARHGARVVLAARSEDKLAATAAAITQEVPGADLDSLLVDLSDLSSVRRAGATATRVGPIHLLVNNAGVMATPEQRTGDGLDLQMATNHFGPFLLTGLLLPQLVASEDARVVSVSSNAHRMARTAPVGDPRTSKGRYRRWQVYGQSKLANLLFTHELDRRARAEDLPVTALAAHPGYTATHLLSSGRTTKQSGSAKAILDAAMRATAQSPQMGALPTLMAATADLPGSTYCGPSGLGEVRGLPRVVTASQLARSPRAQKALWDLSEEVVGLRWP